MDWQISKTYWWGSNTGTEDEFIMHKDENWWSNEGMKVSIEIHGSYWCVQWRVFDVFGEECLLRERSTLAHT